MAESGKVYWLISAPKTNEDTFNTLNKRTTDEQDLSLNYKFQVPDLKVGTLDTLMALNDDLLKMDATVENTCKKIAGQLFDMVDAKEKSESLTVNNNNIDTYLTFFRWDEAKYPIAQPLKTLAETILSQVAKLDEELRTKTSEFNSAAQALSQEERKTSGNLLTRDLSDIVKQEHILASTEYMETLFVVVPKYSSEQWKTQYEKLSQFVVPRSTQLIKEDSEYGLWSVIVFKKIIDDFKNLAREHKFIVRDFTFDINKNVSNDKKKLEAEREKLKKNLVRWCKTNFSEAFVGWIHLKAIRVFVDSVLRYNLPINFQAMLILPHKGKQKKLRKVLSDLYGHLSSRAATLHTKEEDEEGRESGGEQFFPYVFFEISLDYKGKNASFV